MQRFELVDGKSSKFWEIDVQGSAHTVRYGRIGTDGQSKEKSFDDGDAAQAAAEKLIKAKVKKGYAAVGAAPASTPTADPQPAKKAAKKATAKPAAKPAAEPAAKKPGKKQAPSGTSTEGLSEASMASLRAHAFPTRARPEGSVAHMPYIDANPYDGTKFEETFRVYADGKINSHPGLFLREFVKLDDATEKKVRVAVTKLFHEKLASWEKDGSAAGLCAFVLQDDKEIIDALYERAMQPGNVTPHVAAALNGLRDPERVEALVQKCLTGGYWAQFQLNHLDPVTLLVQCGTALVPTLIRLASREFDRADDLADIAEKRTLLALAHAPTAESARYLVGRGEERIVFPLLADSCEMYPKTMMRAALDLLTRSPNHALAGDLVARLLRMNPALAELAETDNQQVLIASFSGGESAPTSSLPASLQAEPWKGLKPLKRPRVAGLLADVSEELVWPEGLRDEWLEHQSYSTDSRYWLRYILGKDFYKANKEALDSKEKGAVLVEEMVKRLGDGSELDPIACFQKRITKSPGYDYNHWGIFQLCFMDPRLSLPMWNAIHPCWWKVTTEAARRLVASYELAALDSLLARVGFADVPSGVTGDGKIGSVGPLLEAALPIASSRLVAPVAQGLSGRQGRKPARRWLLAHAKLAAHGLIPIALGEGRSKKDKAPDGAVTGLQILASEGQRALVEEAAKAYGDEALKAVVQILEASPFALKKAPKLPKWLDISRLAPIETKAGVLDEAATNIVLGMLAASTEEGAYPALDEVQEFCTVESLDAFVWSLFREWAWAGAPSKDKWALVGLGWIGDESVCRNLSTLMLRWPSDGLSARAKVGVEILARIGSERALMALYQFSVKAKTKGLKAAAAEKVDEIAESLGMSTDELADRLVPDLDLGADGRLQFDLTADGAEDELMLQVGLDAHLVPYAMDTEGVRFAKFPKATGAFKGADKVKLKAASKAFKTLAKDAKAVAKHALARLESAMVKQRSWPLDVARRCFFDHPVMRSPALGLIWMTEGKAFRVAEDGTFADLNDDDITLSADVEVHVYHPATVSESARGSAGDLLADYEILQPFEQVARTVYTASDFDMTQWRGREVKSGRVFAVEAYGWKRETDDATKKFNVKGTAKLSYSPGLSGGPDASPTQTLGALEVDVDLKSLDAIDGSELIYDMMRICAE